MKRFTWLVVVGLILGSVRFFCAVQPQSEITGYSRIFALTLRIAGTSLAVIRELGGAELFISHSD